MIEGRPAQSKGGFAASRGGNATATVPSPNGPRRSRRLPCPLPSSCFPRTRPRARRATASVSPSASLDRHGRRAARWRQVVARPLAADLVVDLEEDALLAILLWG